MKLEAEETIQFEGIKPTFWFESDSCVKTKQVMWLDQNGIWWVVKAWPELNLCVDYDFLFTGCCIFRPCVFEAEAVFCSFSSFLVFQSTDTAHQARRLTLRQTNTRG